MKQFKTDLPPLVVSKAKAAGQIGEQWLAGLDDLIAALEQQWKITAGTPLPGGSHAFVSYASGEHGERYVLKIDLPDGFGHTEFSNAIHTLSLADGRGYVKLYACDLERRACLLERLGPSLRQLPYSTEQQLEIICRTLEQSWQLLQEPPVRPGEEPVAWFREFIQSTWFSLDAPCPMEVIETAYRFLDDREANANPAEYVLIHGDAHNANVLQDLTDEDSFKLVDPDCLWYEKAYDLGVLMREWTEEYRLHPLQKGQERCQLLHRLTGVPATAIWQWGFLQCVSTGLLFLAIGQADEGNRFLQVAEAWNSL